MEKVVTNHKVNERNLKMLADIFYTSVFDEEVLESGLPYEPWMSKNDQADKWYEWLKTTLFEADEEEPKQEPKQTERPQVSHYHRLDPEPIDVIKAWDLDFCLGNVVKYISRAGHKEGESRDKDLHKAMDYLRFELEDEGK